MTPAPGQRFTDGDGIEVEIARRTDMDDGWWLTDGSWVKDSCFEPGPSGKAWMTPIDTTKEH